LIFALNISQKTLVHITKYGIIPIVTFEKKAVVIRSEFQGEGSPLKGFCREDGF
jgi:hypothetical protein